MALEVAQGNTYQAQTQTPAIDQLPLDSLQIEQNFSSLSISPAGAALLVAAEAFLNVSFPLERAVEAMNVETAPVINLAEVSFGAPLRAAA